MSLDSAGRARVACGVCGREFPNQERRRTHQNNSQCITARVDYDRPDVEPVVEEAATLLEVQRALGMNREETRHLLKAFDLYRKFRTTGPADLLERVGIEVDATDGETA